MNGQQATGGDESCRCCVGSTKMAELTVLGGISLEREEKRRENLEKHFIIYIYYR